MNYVAGASGATLGFILGDVPGAITGYEVGKHYGDRAMVSGEPPTPPKTPGKRKATSSIAEYLRSRKKFYGSAERTTGSAPDNSFPNSIYMAKNGYKRGYSKKRTYARKKKYTKRAMPMYKQLIAAKPAKHIMYSPSFALLKNSVYSWSPTQIVTRGVNDNQRLGDTITLCALKWNGFINANASSNSYQYRIIIGYTGEEFQADTFLTNYANTQIFQAGSYGAFNTNGIINPKAFSVLYDQKFVLNSLIASTIDSAPVSGSLNLNNVNFPYQAEGSVYGKYKNLVVLVIANEIQASAATDAGGFTCGFDFIFKS